LSANLEGEKGARKGEIHGWELTYFALNTVSCNCNYLISHYSAHLLEASEQAAC